MERAEARGREVGGERGERREERLGRRKRGEGGERGGRGEGREERGEIGQAQESSPCEPHLCLHDLGDADFTHARVRGIVPVRAMCAAHTSVCRCRVPLVLAWCWRMHCSAPERGSSAQNPSTEYQRRRKPLIIETLNT